MCRRGEYLLRARCDIMMMRFRIRAEERLRSIRTSALSRNTLWMIMGQGVRFGVQALYFVIIARALGAEQYGAFVGTAALVSLLAPFVGNGAGNLIVKNASRDKTQFPLYWGNGLLLVLASGLTLSALIAGIGRYALPHSIPLTLALLVCVSDIVLMPLCDLAALAFQAFERLDRYAQIYVFVTTSRLCGAVALVLGLHHSGALQWGYLYAASTLFPAIAAVAYGSYTLGLPRPKVAMIPVEALEGFHFAVGQSARTIYNDIDKVMLARLSTLDATGIYGAAYRLIDVAFVPIRSLLFAAYPQFFQHGQDGLEASYDFAKRLLPRAFIVALAIFVVAILGASLVPVILGTQYAQTATALRWLGLLPLFKTAHHFTGDALTGAGYQGYRSYGQIFIAFFNIGINFWLIPAYGWRGAAWSSLASDGLLALLMYAILVLVRNRCREQNARPISTAPGNRLKKEAEIRSL